MTAVVGVCVFAQHISPVFIIKVHMSIGFDPDRPIIRLQGEDCWGWRAESESAPPYRVGLNPMRCDCVKRFDAVANRKVNRTGVQLKIVCVGGVEGGGVRGFESPHRPTHAVTIRVLPKKPHPHGAR